jgi:hypothetical protein
MLTPHISSLLLRHTWFADETIHQGHSCWLWTTIPHSDQLRKVIREV